MTLAFLQPRSAIAKLNPVSGRLASLDAFRGLVILLMLIVNNVGDPQAVGYFWKHADWSARPLSWGLINQWRSGSLSGFPLFRNCTLADYVMPLFMLIIGVAIPFSAASAKRRGNAGVHYWLGVLRRGFTIYALGWCIGLSLQFLNWRFNAQTGGRLTFVLGMDVLQLLGASYVVARMLYIMPTKTRLAAALMFFIWHWALLRFYPQGTVAAGTFTENHNAIGHIYSSWAVFHSIDLSSWLKFNIVGMLSVPPTVAVMTIGTWIGETLLDPTVKPRIKISRLLRAGCVMIIVGLLWSCDQPMNKPRWTPCYLIYCSGFGAIGLACAYQLIDVDQLSSLFWPLTVLGSNAIGIYFLSVMGKIWLLNMPKIGSANQRPEFFSRYMVETLQHATTPAMGSWLFTVIFVTTVWCAAAAAYKHRLFWKV